nr:uncharacterized protein LOC127347454 [Lolium perenne]
MADTPLPAAPPTDALIHDIAAAYSDDVPCRFKCVLATSSHPTRRIGAHLAELRRHPRRETPAAAGSFFSVMLEVAGAETSAAGLDASLRPAPLAPPRATSSRAQGRPAPADRRRRRGLADVPGVGLRRGASRARPPARQAHVRHGVPGLGLRRGASRARARPPARQARARRPRPPAWRIASAASGEAGTGAASVGAGRPALQLRPRRALAMTPATGRLPRARPLGARARATAPATPRPRLDAAPCRATTRRHALPPHHARTPAGPGRGRVAQPLQAVRVDLGSSSAQRQARRRAAAVLLQRQ